MYFNFNSRLGHSFEPGNQPHLECDLWNATNLIVTVTVAYLQVFTVSIFGDVAICGTTERSECAPSSASLTVQLR
jgi:hypothetical protein